MSLPADFFIAGGTLRAQAPSYVMRPADQELFEHTLAGEFCYVLTPRQMGKSSLMIRTARRLAEAGRTIAILDLTGIGSGSADRWYLGLLEQIARDLRLNIDVPNWWQARASLTIPQRFSEFLRDVVLQVIAGSVVIFIDEIDSTLNLDFRDDFFAAIRAIYNARATENAYKRLTFALLGVATPTDLIRDRERTPFNIGRRIVLQEFSYDEAEALKAGLEACHPGQSEIILRRIFDWTNGYPYLTQKLCLAAAERPATDWDAAQVDELIEATFFSDSGRKDPNFKFVQQRIQESSVAARRQMLNLYRKVYNGKSVPDDDRSQSQNYLELYGLVRVERGRLNVRNNTYRRIFDQQWIAANMPANRDLRLAIGASLVALLAIIVLVVKIIQTPSPSASLYVKQFNDNAFPTARIEALAGLFNLQNGLYDHDDEQGLNLFYNIGPYDQLKLFNEQDALAKGREMATAIRRISLTLDEQDSNDLAIMGEMITALGAAGQPGTDALVAELTNWKSGRELAEKGQYEQAIGYYNLTIQMDDDDVTAHYDRAMALLKLQRYNDALTDLNAMIRVLGTSLEPTPTPSEQPTFTPVSTTSTLVPGSNPAGEIATSNVPDATIIPTLRVTPGYQSASFISRFIGREGIKEVVLDIVRRSKELRDYLQQHQNEEQFVELATIGINDALIIRNAPTPTANPIIAAGATPLLLQTTAAPDPQNTKQLKYAEGIEAYNAKQWPIAVKSFQEVYAIQSNYFDVSSKLADSYQEWGLDAIAQGDAPAALERFNRALVFEPTYAPALEQRTRVLGYLDGLHAMQQQDWQAAIGHFEALRTTAGDYIDSATLLYTCYTRLAAQERQQNNLTVALELYRKAAALPVESNQVAEAQAHVKEIEGLITPLVFTASLFDNPNDGAVQCGSRFEASVWGRVRDNQGGRIRGATVQVASADGKNRYKALTNGKGEFKISGLGCATWVVRLTSVPDAPGGLQSGKVSAFINGGNLSGAGVEFQQK